MTRSSRTTTEESLPSIQDLLYNNPGFLTRRMHQICVSIFIEETKELDITPLQYGVMAAVLSQPGIDQIGVSEMVGLDRTTVLGIVDRLERKKFLVRKVDLQDRRVRRLHLTDAGRAKFAETQGATERQHKRLLAPLNPKERAAFLATAKKIVTYHNENTRVPINDAPRSTRAKRKTASSK
jgi:DNA-binding MarR family transcriptional regulator